MWTRFLQLIEWLGLIELIEEQPTLGPVPETDAAVQVRIVVGKVRVQ